MKRLAAITFAILLVGTAYAHGPEKGPHGGTQVDAGDYHVELVAKETTLSVFVSDAKIAPIDAKGFKGIGIFVVGGKPQRIELKFESGNKLAGTSSVPLPTSLKGAVQLTPPTGKTIQAKFE